MISALAWVPKGVADPNPKRYEMSAMEEEMIKMYQQQSLQDNNKGGNNNNKGNRSKADEIKQQLSKIQKEQEHDDELPADLKMDEYSDDDDEGGGGEGAALGKLLVGRQREEEEEDLVEVLDDPEEDEIMEQVMKDQKANNDDGGDSSDEEQDNLDDIPDTREFVPVNVEGLQGMNIGAGVMGFDDYMNQQEEDDDNDSELEDTRLTSDDAMLVLAKAEDDFASLEVHVYDQKNGNLFVHHDIPLPAYPLSLAHGDIHANGEAGNFIAVGTFHPGIEIWNLDVLHALEPICILGGEDTSAADELPVLNAKNKEPANMSKKKKEKNGLKPGSHTDAVMALSWNSVHRQVIASGSADTTVKLWDITAGSGSSPSATFTHHKDKVQAVAWHPVEGTMFASGAYDGTLALVDARSSGSSGNCKKTKLLADCEALAWDPHVGHLLTAATEDGSVTCWDVRRLEEPVWSFVAHEFGCSDFSYNVKIPGFMVTCSVDKTVALWDTRNASLASAPVSCGSKEMNVGKLYAASFYPSTPWLLGCGGAGNELAIWDLSSEEALHSRFQDRIAGGDTLSDAPPKTNNKEEFEAMMSQTNENDDEEATIQKDKKKKKKKKGGKNKNKTHKRGA